MNLKTHTKEKAINVPDGNLMSHLALNISVAAMLKCVLSDSQKLQDLWETHKKIISIDKGIANLTKAGKIIFNSDI